MTTKHLRQSFYLLKITHHKAHKARDGPKLDGSSRMEYELSVDWWKRIPETDRHEEKLKFCVKKNCNTFQKILEWLNRKSFRKTTLSICLISCTDSSFSWMILATLIAWQLSWQCTDDMCCALKDDNEKANSSRLNFAIPYKHSHCVRHSNNESLLAEGNKFITGCRGRELLRCCFRLLDSTPDVPGKIFRVLFQEISKHNKTVFFPMDILSDIIRNWHIWGTLNDLSTKHYEKNNWTLLIEAGHCRDGTVRNAWKILLLKTWRHEATWGSYT